MVVKNRSLRADYRMDGLGKFLVETDGFQHVRKVRKREAHLELRTRMAPGIVQRTMVGGIRLAFIEIHGDRPRIDFLSLPLQNDRLTKHIGANSPLFKMLSPEQSDGLISQVQSVIPGENAAWINVLDAQQSATNPQR